ncbi:hypothetical protein A0J57_03905 [Sphingobium sp. 22B]|nr:hypothetical protein AXW74_00455 [Sphingobium sp. AM]KYC33738.1 hypothetical protein A0J57_03905 [Sphingobium sp. 22B]
MAAICAVPSIPAWAQSGGTPADQASAGQLEDIVVTAQRRAERLQDVPIAVSAVTSDALARQGVDSLVGLNASVPGLQFQTTGVASAVYLRGVGTNDGNPNIEQSVALYIDGVYIASPNAALNQFNNIQRVEVLKGPQGTLFGRNATGGVIQIVTRDPSHTPGGEFSAGYANYDTFSANGYVTGPIGSTLAADVAVTWRHQGDGFGRNLILDRETRKSKNFGIRSKLIWEPTDALTVRLSGDYAKSSAMHPDFVLPKGVLGIDGELTTGSFDTRTNVVPTGDLKQYGGSLRLEYDAGSVLFTSITAYRETHTHSAFDSDGTPLDFIRADLPNRQRNWTQEFQISSPSASPVQWIVGAFYYDNKARYVSGRLSGLAIELSGVPYIDFNNGQSSKSYAGFGQATVELVKGLKATGGLRYTSEKQRFFGDTRTIFGIVPVGPQEQSFDKLTWRMALDYEVARDVHGYISYNRGVKSGGFNLLTPTAPSFRPEILDAYEVGLKSELFDRRLRLNAAAFLYKYKDIQLQVIRNGTSFSTNAARATIKGIEAEIQAIPIENLTITAGFSILDGQYDRYPDAPLFTPSPLTPHPATQDATGNDTVAAPPFAGNIGFEYVVPTKAGRFALSSSLYYNDGYYFGPDKNFPQKNYYLLSAALGWTSPDERYGLRLWGANLTNEYYLQQGSPGGFGNLTIRADPRTYGVTGTVKF